MVSIAHICIAYLLVSARRPIVATQIDAWNLCSVGMWDLPAHLNGY